MDTLTTIRNEAILRDLEASTRRFEEALDLIIPADFHRPGAEEGWSPAQVAEHLVASETGINKAMRKAEATDRPPDEKVDLIRRGLSDRSRRYPAPDMLLPTNGQYRAEQLRAAFLAQRALTHAMIGELDMTELVDFPHPYFGKLTRMEWIYFNIHHTDRHLLQMKGTRP